MKEPLNNPLVAEKIPAKKNDLNAGHRQRLRQRFLRAGLEGLEEYEAFELLLTYAIARRDVKPIAKALVREFISVEKILDATPRQIAAVEGIGENSAILIALIKSLCTRYLQQKMIATTILDTPQTVIDFARMKLGGLAKETLMVIFLNSQNGVIGFHTWPGTVNLAAIFPREVLEACVTENAVSIILIHNHPSGLCEPSPEDINLTRKLRRDLESVNIKVVDHIIVTAATHLSLRAKGLI